MKEFDETLYEGNGEKNYWLYFLALMILLTLVFILISVVGAFQYKSLAMDVLKKENDLNLIQDDGKQLNEIGTLQTKLEDKEELIKGFVRVRRKIIKELLNEFTQSNLELEIDGQTGAIRFSEGIFFDSNQYVIKEDGKKYLNQFIPAYMSILISESNRKYISQIIIEGHTDDQGSYLYNLDLSQRRAFTVVKYIISSSKVNFPNKETAIKYLTANGRSYSQPIMVNGEIDRNKSRRVEFKFRLKDDELIKEMQDIFEGEK